MKENQPDMQNKDSQISSEILLEVRQWVNKAEHFFEGAERMVEKTKPVNADLACLLSHAATERYLKAFLILSGQISSQKELREYGHDLSKSNADCMDMDQEFRRILDEVEVLNNYKPALDYPSLHSRPVVVLESKAMEAVEYAGKIREFVLRKLKERGYR